MRVPNGGAEGCGLGDAHRSERQPVNLLLDDALVTPAADVQRVDSQRERNLVPVESVKKQIKM